MNQQIRLNKYLAERLGVSRREADDLILKGEIFVNEKPAVTGVKVDKNDKVCYNKKIVPFDTEFSYVAFNKPVGYVCSRRAQGSTPTLYELLPKKYRNLKTVGRLDKDSSGLILLTDDGDFAYQMTHPRFRKEKIYEVELDHPLEPLHQQMISDFGVMLDDGPSKFVIIRGGFTTPLSRNLRDRRGAREATEPRNDGCEGAGPRKMVSQNTYTVILTEGRNRQIRRTFAALGYKVVKLHRTQFGKYKLGDLAFGKCDIIKL